MIRVNLRQIDYILAAVEVGSFRKAGILLGVEQSAISRRVREVEEAIGGQLFTRHSAGVELTQIGTDFVKKVRDGANEITLALQAAQEAVDGGRRLRVGIFGPLTMGFLSDLFRAFRRERPGTGVRFSEASSPELIAAVRRGQLDVGIVAEATPGTDYEVTHLWIEPVYLAIPNSDPLADQKAVRWDDLRDLRFVVTDLPTGVFAKDYLERHLGVPRDGLHIEQLSVARESLMQIVAHHGGVTIAGSAHVRRGLPGITFRPIQDAVLRYGAVHSRRTHHRDLERLLALASALSEDERV